jgi:hypothetical protein
MLWKLSAKPIWFATCWSVAGIEMLDQSNWNAGLPNRIAK